MPLVLVVLAKSTSIAVAKSADSILQVAVGVVVDASRRVLVAKRPSGKAHAGKWEFPGGKIEAGESPQQALMREFAEECDLTLVSTAHLCDVVWEYPGNVVCLRTYLCTEFSGRVFGREGQVVEWVPLEALSALSFPEANIEILRALEHRFSLERSSP